MIYSVIGLGKMGGSVARRFLELGNTVQVYDVNGEAVTRLVSQGAAAVTLSELSNSDVLFVSLPNDEIVLEVLVQQGVVESLKAGAVLIELSTILPKTMLIVDEIAGKRGVHVIDSPVSGGPAEVEKGELTLLVGATDEGMNVATPVLQSLGVIHHVGAVGKGKAVKLVNNIMTMCNMAAACEAFTLGVKAGIEPQLLYDVLNNSRGRSFHFTKRMPKVLARDFEAGFPLYLGEKDLRTSLAFAHDEGYPMPITATVHQMYELARSKGLGSLDIAAVIQLYEEWGNAVVKKEG
jgi:3-hydroxyisobutyrate dehydrogenase-like beta-hydroxyacid dehydrogenase